MRINHNITAINAHRNVTGTNWSIDKRMEKLSSGLRVNRASDDAAGLAISEKMRGQIRGLNMATRNAQDGISLIQTSEGALNEAHAILQRMRELAVQAANDTNTNEDREKLQLEMNQLRKEIDRIANSTEFNTKKIFTGDFVDSGLFFQIGANEGQQIEMKINKMDAKTLGINGKKVVIEQNVDGTETKKEEDDPTKSVSLATRWEADKAITIVNDALEEVSRERAKFGAYQNRLEHTINNLRVAAENLQASESRIRDADMANEMVGLNKDKIISQAGTAMLAQANTTPQGVLQLLK